MEILRTKRDVAKQLGTSQSKIAKLYLSGQPEAINLGPRCVRFTDEAVETLIKNNSTFQTKGQA